VTVLGEPAKENRQLPTDLVPTLFGRVIYHCFPFRRNIVLENIRTVFGDSPDARSVKTFAQSVYGHLFTGCMENLSVIWMSREDILKRVRVEGQAHLFAAAEQKKGILLLTGHLGNWEFAPTAAMLQFPQFRGRFHILRRTLINKRIEKILFERYSAAGFNILPKKHSLDQVLGFLADNDVVVFVLDQYANPSKDGIRAEFFGKETGTFRSLALIARATGAPVVPACSYRQKDGTHVMKFFPALSWIRHEDAGTEVYQNTLAYNRALERMILDHPDQWIWIHRRWKEKK
jgi:Kdo2-lipid IVA lauroyltransferase/acyltransferase